MLTAKMAGEYWKKIANHKNGYTYFNSIYAYIKNNWIEPENYNKQVN